MRVVFGDLWNELGKADLLLVTGNGAIRMDGAVVMGRGAAAYAKERFPGVDLEFGRLIREQGEFMPQLRCFVFGFVLAAPTQYHPVTRLGLFQVKYLWSEKADPDLIMDSIVALRSFLSFNFFRRVVMNYPGIGNGGLSIKDVAPLVDILPENVLLYRRKTEGGDIGGRRELAFAQG